MVRASTPILSRDSSQRRFVCEPNNAKVGDVEILTWILTGVLILTSFILIAFVLLHKGKGGGMSDMFGGGMSANLGSSGVAEKNLNMYTTLIAIVWAASIVLLGLIASFQA